MTIAERALWGRRAAGEVTMWNQSWSKNHHNADAVQENGYVLRSLCKYVFFYYGVCVFLCTRVLDLAERGFLFTFAFRVYFFNRDHGWCAFNKQHEGDKADVLSQGRISLFGNVFSVLSGILCGGRAVMRSVDGLIVQRWQRALLCGGLVLQRSRVQWLGGRWSAWL